MHRRRFDSCKPWARGAAADNGDGAVMACRSPTGCPGRCRTCYGRLNTVAAARIPPRTAQYTPRRQGVMAIAGGGVTMRKSGRWVHRVPQICRAAASAEYAAIIFHRDGARRTRRNVWALVYIDDRDSLVGTVHVCRCRCRRRTAGPWGPRAHAPTRHTSSSRLTGSSARASSSSTQTMQESRGRVFGGMAPTEKSVQAERQLTPCIRVCVGRTTVSVAGYQATSLRVLGLQNGDSEISSQNQN
ncbi:hypothetical protein C8F04DRAFT_1084569 [Mycena alexandri]|uniref:Uncharacterized protein n=1 Tax=Mycena alexandri TaxID=1745969 RepID=A0AAD6T7Y6_9AGAR|nr:hypothetical protein C8F04DRAFT_1084569 [Mycena alexandri]